MDTQQELRSSVNPHLVMILEKQVKIYKIIRRKKHSKHSVFFIRANTKKCGQITLNT